MIGGQMQIRLRDVDVYIKFECAFCSHPYQMPVRQWRGRDEVILPAMNCAECNRYVWMATGKTDTLELRKNLENEWGSSQ